MTDDREVNELIKVHASDLWGRLDQDHLLWDTLNNTVGDVVSDAQYELEAIEGEWLVIRARGYFEGEEE